LLAIYLSDPLFSHQAAEWQPKINSVIDWFGQLQQIDLSGVQPAIHGTEASQLNMLRADQPMLNEERQQVLAMAPSVENGYVRVPKVAAAPH
jgi:aspartyl-tRNA(Asn)/glutamyl-tRNA(Gln) amidotransferase subunit C